MSDPNDNVFDRLQRLIEDYGYARYYEGREEGIANELGTYRLPVKEESDYIMDDIDVLIRTIERSIEVIEE